jgi:hypothetical protein
MKLPVTIDQYICGKEKAAEPEEVMSVLRDYHARMGEQVLAYEGTLEAYSVRGLKG